MMRTRATVASLVLLALVSAVGAARAAPTAVSLLDRSAPLPAEVRVKGSTVEQAWRWTEDGGKTSSLAVFSSTQREVDQAIESHKLFVQLYRGASGSLKEARLVQDGVDSGTCTFDVVVGFVPGSVTITDEDKDGAAELTFAYEVTCTSDLSPSTRKLLVLEGAAKHILRGRNRVDVGDGVVEGGDFKAAGFQGQPALLRFAEKRWKQLLVVSLAPQ